MSIQLSIVVAHDQKLGIGKDGNLPWHIPADLKHFRKLTTESNKNHTSDNRSPSNSLEACLNAVIMGRVTWDSIPPHNRPLAKRLNIVLSQQIDLELPAAVHQCSNFKNLLDLVTSLNVTNCFVIGGAQIYQLALATGLIKYIYVTEILGSFACDRLFPEYRQEFELVAVSNIQSENNFNFQFKTYKHK